jgi:transcriptional regulator with XRE-family HTH domain
MAGIDLKELGKKKPAIARARAIVDAVNSGAKAMRDFRTKSGLSQAGMAKKIGLTQPRIAQLESGKPGNAPSLEQLADTAFQTGNALLVCDRSQLDQLPEYRSLAQEVASLKKEVNSLKEQINELESQRASAAKWFPRIKWLGSGRAAPSGSIPLPVIPLRAMPVGASGAGHRLKGYVIIADERDASVTWPDDSNELVARAEEAAEQWAHSVSEETLKELAQSFETSANEGQSPSAYEVLNRVSRKIGATIAIEGFTNRGEGENT